MNIKSLTVAIVGNPNCGKTCLFNNLTGANHKIGNWPGVTVEKKVGGFFHKEHDIEVVDLPGIYSLSPKSIDERVARDYIIGSVRDFGVHKHMRRKGLHEKEDMFEHRRGKHLHQRTDNKLNRNNRGNRLRRRMRRGLRNHDDYITETKSSKPDIIINIVDASNLERNLYLTTQLIDMNVPIIIALNMIDVAKSKAIKIDSKKLSKTLGVPVVELIASKNFGTEELRNTLVKEYNKQIIDVPYDRNIENAINKNSFNVIDVPYDRNIENTINKLKNSFNGIPKELKVNSRWLSIKLLEKDEFLLKDIERIDPDKIPVINGIINNLESEEKEDSEILIADSRYSYIKDTADKVQIKKDEFSQTVSDKIDKIVLSRILGIPIFLLILYALFWISTEVAGAGIDFMDALFNGGTLLYWEFNGIIPLLQGVIGEGNWIDIGLLQGVLGGVGTVLTFIPILFLVFLILAFLEDWGYLARAATVMDRFMRFIGLPGKAFISFILGFGCTVPAIMSTRTLEDADERWLTIMLVPFMSCGARLPVYIFFGAIFFSHWGGSLIFLLYITGIVLAIIVGLILKRWKMKGKQVSTFVIELPPYHIPSVKSVMLTMWKRLSAFLKTAGAVITVIVLILTIMANIQLYKPADADENYVFEANSKESLIGEIGEKVSVIFKPLRFGAIQQGPHKGKTNWRAGVSIFTGLFAKEAIVGTFGALYELGEEVEAPEFPEPVDTDILPTELSLNISEETPVEELDKNVERLNEYLETLPEKDENKEAIAEYVEGLDAVNNWYKLESVIGKDFSSFSAFLFLLFILIYTPCIAVIGATYRELGKKWAAFQAIGLIILAYIVVLLVSLIGGIFLGIGI